MSTNFDWAAAFTLTREGGYVNSLGDPGGSTKYGISLRWLRSLDPGAGDINGDGDVDASDIFKLTEDDAKVLYREKFWDALKCESLYPALALAFFDAAVNCGPVRSVRWLQQAMNEYSSPPLKVDGVMGPATLESAENWCGNWQIIDACLFARLGYYNQLANQKRFRGFHLGWTRRVCALREYIKQHDKETTNA